MCRNSVTIFSCDRLYVRGKPGFSCAIGAYENYGVARLCQNWHERLRLNFLITNWDIKFHWHVYAFPRSNNGFK